MPSREPSPQRQWLGIAVNAWIAAAVCLSVLTFAVCCGLAIPGIARRAQENRERAAKRGDNEEAPPNQEAMIGDLSVRLDSAKVDTPVLTSGGRTDSKRLILSLSITNGSDTKKYSYHGWAKEFDHRGERATLKDDLGNHYKGILPPLGKRYEGQLARGDSIYPGKTIAETLVFEEPVERASQLILTLPGKTVELGGQMQFKVPVNRIQR